MPKIVPFPRRRHPIDRVLYRFRTIEPFFHPHLFPELWKQVRYRRGELIRVVAANHGIAPRTLYHWIQSWRVSKLKGFMKKTRKDLGKAKALNEAALDFLDAAVRLGYGITATDMERAYRDERSERNRLRSCRGVLGDFEKVKYQKYLDASGRLAENALLPAMKPRTLATWFWRVRRQVRAERQ